MENKSKALEKKKEAKSKTLNQQWTSKIIYQCSFQLFTDINHQKHKEEPIYTRFLLADKVTQRSFTWNTSILKQKFP